MVLCYKITHKYKELLPFLLYLMIASIYYENITLPSEDFSKIILISFGSASVSLTVS